MQPFLCHNYYTLLDGSSSPCSSCSSQKLFGYSLKLGKRHAVFSNSFCPRVLHFLSSMSQKKKRKRNHKQNSKSYSYFSPLVILNIFIIMSDLQTKTRPDLQKPASRVIFPFCCFVFLIYASPKALILQHPRLDKHFQRKWRNFLDVSAEKAPTQREQGN